MKIYCDGARFAAGQIQRIEQGFVELGHEITPYAGEADLVYANNPWFDQLIADKETGLITGKMIFDVQDIPHHIPDYDIERLARQLSTADGVTTISQTTADDLKRAIGVDSTVIWQPIMPVTRNLETRKVTRAKFLFVGRVSDPNKRTHLAAKAMSKLLYTAKDVLTVGFEMPYFGGEYWGVASPAGLKDIYNSVDYVVATARFGGIELPMMEACAAGAIPIVCNDLHTRNEFLKGFNEYDRVEPTADSIADFIQNLESNPEAKQDLRERLHRHYLVNWFEKLSPKGVAGRILKLYELL